MSNRITFGNFTFIDEQITSAKIHQEESPIAETLDADTLALVVQSNDLGDGTLYSVLNEMFQPSDYEEFVIEGEDILDYKYAEPIYYYKDNVLIGKFYITEIDRKSEDRFLISATSAIGLLVRQKFAGGVYAGTSAGTLINSIMSGTNIPYTVDSSVANTVINGYLPYGYKREALQMILNAIGANVLKNATTGALRFVYNLPSTSKAVPDSRMYVGGTNKITSPITKVTVTEHTYYQNPASESEIIYTHSGVSANHSLVILDEPIVPSTITKDSGITIHSSGANFVEFSGIGNIYAIKYTHVSSIVSWENPDTTLEEHPCNISSNTLITALNSANVLARFKKYYTQAKETDCSIVLADEKPGDYISYTDPYGDEATGFIKSMEIGVSNTNKADTTLITNWYPTDSGNNFNAYQLIQTTGTVTVPTAARGKPGRIILFGGFCGGQGGTAGEAGTGSTQESSKTGQGYYVRPGSGGTHGGKGGAGGSGVRVYTVSLSSLPSSFSVTAIGVGGAGGAAGAYQGTGSLGSIGGNTTVTVNGTSYSSASGAIDYVGFINFIDGTYYNVPGKSGLDNDNSYGGDGGQYSSGGSSGSSFTYNGTTWSGGSGSKEVSGKGSSWYIGGGGGGAAYGTKGNDGRGGGNYIGGSGGAGATPATPSQATFPNCGDGGHGGGAGGGGGGGYCYEGHTNTPSSGGAGGAGSPGGQGSDGAVIFYYGT